MKRRALSLLFLFLLCFASGVRAEVTARDGAGHSLAPGEALAPESALRVAFALEALPQSPVLRLRLSGMTLVSVSFHTEGTTLHPEIVYGSDGCVFLFTGPVHAGDTIYLEALLRDTPGEAAASLLLDGKVWMEFPCAAEAAAAPGPAAVPAMAEAAVQTEAAAETPPPESSGVSWALALLCALGLGVAGYVYILRPRLRADEKKNGAQDGEREGKEEKPS